VPVWRPLDEALSSRWVWIALYVLEHERLSEVQKILSHGFKSDCENYDDHFN